MIKRNNKLMMIIMKKNLNYLTFELFKDVIIYLFDIQNVSSINFLCPQFIKNKS